MSTDALKREVSRLRQKNRQLEKAKRELIEMYTIDTDLSEEGKYYTALAWNNYPSPAFTELVNTLRAAGHTELADLLGKHGIDFRVLASGDTYKASGFPASGIALDTEEWYESIYRAINSDAWRELYEDKNGEPYQAIQDAVDVFGNTIVQEVKEAIVNEK